MLSPRFGRTGAGPGAVTAAPIGHDRRAHRERAATGDVFADTLDNRHGVSPCRRVWYKGRVRSRVGFRIRIGIRLLTDHTLSAPTTIPPIPERIYWRLTAKRYDSDSRGDAHQLINRHAGALGQRFQPTLARMRGFEFELAVIALRDAEMIRRFMLRKPLRLPPGRQGAMRFDPLDVRTPRGTLAGRRVRTRFWNHRGQNIFRTIARCQWVDWE